MSEKRVNDLTPISTLSGGVSFLVDGNVTNKIEYQDLLDSLRADLLGVETYTVPKPDNTDNLTYTEWYVGLSRSGKSITIDFSISGSITANGDANTLFVLPSKYVPNKTIHNNFISQNGKNMLLTFRTNGNVDLYNLSGGAISSTYIVRQIITFMARN